MKIKNQTEMESVWNESYSRKENHLFYPCDELVRFVSRYLRRRIGLDEFVDVIPKKSNCRMIDIGCGIGRNLVFGTAMGFEMYGNDLSENAVSLAQEWLTREIGSNAKDRVVACSVSDLPWENDFFDHAISDSVLDSMPFETAQAGVAEIARILRSGGYFYCNLISGDEAGRDPDFCEEIIVQTEHERNTIQSYFNRTKIRRLLEPLFEILSCQLHKIVDQHKGTLSARWHIVSRHR